MKHTITILIFCIARFAIAQEIPLWPKGAPGSEGKSGKEKVRISDEGDHVISNIHAPSITPFLPTKEKATGACIIIAPGGGHRELWIDHEGYTPAKWLQDHGIAAIVLKYRLAKEDGSTYTVDEHALADIQRATRMVRSRAVEWNINPARVGVMGFSAGGELAGLAAMRSDIGNERTGDAIDKFSSHPDFQALIYPGGFGRLMEVTKDSAPIFLLGGYKDRDDIAKGMAQLYLKYKDAGVPAELHIYAGAGHGFGMRDKNKGTLAGWPMRLFEWLREMGFLSKVEH